MESVEVFEHPWLVVIVLPLSIVSTWYCWIGFRQKDVPRLLIGLGMGLPTFSITNVWMWVAGVAVCALGYWLMNAQ